MSETGVEYYHVCKAQGRKRSLGVRKRKAGFPGSSKKADDAENANYGVLLAGKMSHTSTSGNINRRLRRAETRRNYCPSPITQSVRQTYAMRRSMSQNGTRLHV
jgi:hypothetical protein